VSLGSIPLFSPCTLTVTHSTTWSTTHDVVTSGVDSSVSTSERMFSLEFDHFKCRLEPLHIHWAKHIYSELINILPQKSHDEIEPPTVLTTFPGV